MTSEIFSGGFRGGAAFVRDHMIKHTSLSRVLGPLLLIGSGIFLATAPLKAAIVTSTDLGLGGITLGSDALRFVDAEYASFVDAETGALLDRVFLVTARNADSATAMVEWNIDGTGPAEFLIENFLGYGSGDSWVGKSISTAYPSYSYWPGSSLLGGYYDPWLSPLALGTEVGANDNYKPSAWLADIPWGYPDYPSRTLLGEPGGAGDAYIGFWFKPADTVLYGWAFISLEASGRSSEFDLGLLGPPVNGDFGRFTIHHWAYDDTGAPIMVGRTTVIPEPAGSGFYAAALALGLAGSRRARKPLDRAD